MADAITIKALQDASLDAKSLEDVVNGDEAKQVTTRLGETYPSVKKAIKTMFENGGLPATPFTTKALMTASVLVDGKYAMVTDDSVATNNGLYLKVSGIWQKSSYSIDVAIKNIDKSIMVSDIKGEADATGEVVYGEFYTSSGATTTYANTIRTAKIKLDSITDIWVTQNNGGFSSGSLRTVFYDSNYAFISAHAAIPNDTPTKLTIPTGAVYVGVSGSSQFPFSVVRKSSVDGVTIAGMQGAIDSLASDFSTVSGGVKSKNLIFVTDGRYWNKDTGKLTTSGTFHATAMTEIPQGTDLFLNGDAADAAGFQVLFFDEDKVLLTSEFDRLRKYSNYKVNIPVRAKYVAVSNASTLTFTAKLVGDILLGFDDIIQTYEPVKNTALSSVKNAHSTNLYELGGNYAAIKAQRVRDNYGILFAGQSNMVGMAAHSQLSTLGLPETLAINNWNGSSFDASQTLDSSKTWGVWWSLLKRLKDYKPNTDIYSYKLAAGSTALHTSWNPHNFSYQFDTFMREIDEIKKLDLVNIKAVVWWQGESDSISPYAEEYEQRLKDFINAVRGAANDPLLPFVVLGVHKNAGYWYSPVVRAAQIRASIDMPNVYFVDVDDVPYTTAVGQGNHYDGVFFEAVAPRVFDIIKDL